MLNIYCTHIKFSTLHWDFVTTWSSIVGSWGSLSLDSSPTSRWMIPGSLSLWRTKARSLHQSWCSRWWWHYPQWRGTRRALLEYRLILLMGQFTKTPDTAPPTVIQAEGVVGGGGVKERGHSAESEISALIQERKEVTRAITEALPAWHPCMPQDTIPIVS